MRRREFIYASRWCGGFGRLRHARSRASGCGASACSCPHARTIRTWQARVGAFLQALAQLGWTIGRNVRIDTRWAGGKPNDIRRHAAELAALAPDVILAHGASTVGPLLQATRTVPIVFPLVADPVGCRLRRQLWRGRAATPPVSCFSNTA